MLSRLPDEICRHVYSYVMADALACLRPVAYRKRVDGGVFQSETYPERDTVVCKIFDGNGLLQRMDRYRLLADDKDKKFYYEKRLETMMWRNGVFLARYSRKDNDLNNPLVPSKTPF